MIKNPMVYSVITEPKLPMVELLSLRWISKYDTSVHDIIIIIITLLYDSYHFVKHTGKDSQLHL
jgi:hypothetical protein